MHCDGWLPGLGRASPLDRLRASLGALLGILFPGFVSTIAVGSDVSLPLLIAPMGASAVLLFAAPTSPLAQPWSILGGDTVAAQIGVLSALLISNPVIAAAVAVGLAIAAMLVLGCLHPPSGAVALTAVLGGPAVHKAGLLLVAVAILFNNLTGRRADNFETPARTALRQILRAANFRTILEYCAERFCVGNAHARVRQHDGETDRRAAGARQ